MQRYRIDSQYIPNVGSLPIAVEDNEGEWVRNVDIKNRLLTALKSGDGADVCYELEHIIKELE